MKHSTTYSATTLWKSDPGKGVQFVDTRPASGALHIRSRAPADTPRCLQLGRLRGYPGSSFGQTGRRTPLRGPTAHETTTLPSNSLSGLTTLQAHAKDPDPHRYSRNSGGRSSLRFRPRDLRH